MDQDFGTLLMGWMSPDWIDGRGRPRCTRLAAAISSEMGLSKPRGSSWVSNWLRQGKCPELAAVSALITVLALNGAQVLALYAACGIPIPRALERPRRRRAIHAA